MEETWKDIDGFPGYQVSNKGQVRCFRDFHGKITSSPRYLKPILNKDDYFYVDLYTIEHKQVHKRIHRLVLDTFIGPMPDLVANHKDGNKHNNNLNNLEWVTAKENSTHASETGLYKTKSVRIIETDEEFDSIKECAKTLGVHPSCISVALADRTKTAKGLHFEFVDAVVKKQKSFLYDYQMDAVKRMFTGCILNGGVGSGKSRTGLYYYFSQCGGSIDPDYIPMTNPKNLLILTTAMKRDKLEWDEELTHYLMSVHLDVNYYDNKIIIDSWNNIKKYENLEGWFIIFDEDRVTGNGVWVKTFLKLAKKNDWVILSATAGDRWEDYIPVFIANGFYKNRTEFIREHIVYSRFSKYPKVDRYLNTGRLIRLRNKILIDMDFKRHTIPHHEDIYVNYDVQRYKETGKLRWDPFKNEPIQNASGLCYVWRKIVNSDPSRLLEILAICEEHPRVIIFYNFDYELNLLKGLYYGEGIEIAEWNGHKHQPIPDSERWVYLVQYTAGCEGWNSTKTDTIVFYSQNYSYKVMEQAAGRIDRLNSPFTDLYYYHLKSRSGIDLAISKALREKKNFNEGRFVKW